MTRAFILCVQFNITRHYYVHAFFRDAFMFRLAPTIHCILTSNIMYVCAYSGTLVHTYLKIKHGYTMSVLICIMTIRLSMYVCST